MIEIRRSQERGFANHGWLKSLHTFSFADYYDPRHMGFRSLRVINEDRIQGGSGFQAHPHRDMEIISYVIAGALEHQDSLGTKTIIRPGEVQRMSAGAGVVHSEFNALSDQESHFLQIWIQPNAKGGSPAYGQKSFENQLGQKKLVLAVSQDGREGSIGIKQNAEMFLSRLQPDEVLEYSLRPNRGVWIQIVKGTVQVNNSTLRAGDALSAENESNLYIHADELSEFILFDLA
jgi:redox-sensitive bicupin YhaK (pirin superfamily)